MVWTNGLIEHMRWRSTETDTEKQHHCNGQIYTHCGQQAHSCPHAQNRVLAKIMIVVDYSLGANGNDDLHGKQTKTK